MLGDGTVPTTVRVTDRAVADFAVGAYLTSLQLASGNKVDFTMFRCLPDWGLSAINARPISAVVSDDEEKREGSSRAEPVWIVRGDAGYPFVAVIAKSDRMLLRSVTPQGSVGYSTDSYVRTR